MVLEAGVFQADPHPGNLLVTDDDRLVVLDFGAARQMDEETRRGYLELLAAFIFDDRDLMVRRLDSLGFRTRSGAPDTLLAFADALLAEMRHAVQSDAPFTKYTMDELVADAAVSAPFVEPNGLESCVHMQQSHRTLAQNRFDMFDQQSA